MFFFFASFFFIIFIPLAMLLLRNCIIFLIYNIVYDIFQIHFWRNCGCVCMFLKSQTVCSYTFQLFSHMMEYIWNQSPHTQKNRPCKMWRQRFRCVSCFFSSFSFFAIWSFFFGGLFFVGCILRIYDRMCTMCICVYLSAIFGCLYWVVGCFAFVCKMI